MQYGVDVVDAEERVEDVVRLVEPDQMMVGKHPLHLCFEVAPLRHAVEILEDRETAFDQIRTKRRGLLIGAHLDEREAARPTGLPIRHHLGVRDRAELAEDFLQLQLGRVVREIANIKSSTHFDFSLR